MATIAPTTFALQGVSSPVADTTAIGFYLVYAVVAVGLVVYLARTLSRNGGLFLKNVFTDEEGLAGAVNQLLVVGFYLLNLGYALLIYRLQVQYSSLITAFNELVVRLGILLLSLGVIHLLNMLVFWKIRSGANKPTSTQLLEARLERIPPVVNKPTPPAAPAPR